MTSHSLQCFSPSTERIPTIRAGYLKLYMGPMYSGKTSRLMKKITKLADLGMSVLYVNYSEYKRESYGDDRCSTHNSQFTHISPKIATLKKIQLNEIDISPYSVIGVDESQFFLDLVPVVSRWVHGDRKIVFCAGLDGDFRRRPIGNLLGLISLANDYKKLSAKCHQCLEDSLDNYIVTSMVDAPFTARIVPGEEQKLIGGTDAYVPLCRYHYEHYYASTD